VCVKQVPDTAEVLLDPFDICALEAAARIKEKNPGSKIVAVTMEAPRAKNVLAECISIAADKAYLISRSRLGGSDAYITDYILSRTIKKIEDAEGAFDMIFCGKQAIEGGTGQAGAGLAEHLGYPQVMYGLEVEAEKNRLLVTKKCEKGKKVIAVHYPCVVTFVKSFTKPYFQRVTGGNICRL